MSFAEKPSARSAETACTVESAVRNSAVSNILVLPNSDYRKEPREKQIEQRHGHKRSCRDGDLDPGRRIGAPRRGQARPGERVHVNAKQTHQQQQVAEIIEVQGPQVTLQMQKAAQ